MTAVSIEVRPATARTRLADAPLPQSGSRRRRHPHSYPERGIPTAYGGSARNGVRACRLSDATVVPVPVASWRLTDRGVAVVLVVGLMIMVAALTVVGLTAVQVTGSDYRPGGSALGQPR